MHIGTFCLQILVITVALRAREVDQFPWEDIDDLEETQETAQTSVFRKYVGPWMILGLRL